MNGPVFVDTNVLIYAFDDADLQKQSSARRWRTELWKSRQGRVSMLVLQEFYAKVSKKSPKSADQARLEVRDLMAWRPAVVDFAIVERSWKIVDRYQLSFWDALILAAAKSLGCGFLLTEDLQAGQQVEDIRIINPFVNEPSVLQRAF